MPDFGLKKYCINLNRRLDRWERAQAEFDKLGIDVERFDAIDTGDWRGARLSHLAIIEQAKRENLESVMVFEDDVEFIITELTYYEKAINSLPDDWHMLYFGANTSRHLERFNDYLFKARGCLALHSVLYHKSVYDLVLKCPDIQIDLYIRNKIQPLGKCFITSELCTTQRPDFSDIENVNVNYGFMQDFFKQNTTIA